jgi:hypothetical protein
MTLTQGAAKFLHEMDSQDYSTRVLTECALIVGKMLGGPSSMLRDCHVVCNSLDQGRPANLPYSPDEFLNSGSDYTDRFLPVYFSTAML